jgi:hypothetical protein
MNTADGTTSAHSTVHNTYGESNMSGDPDDSALASYKLRTDDINVPSIERDWPPGPTLQNDWSRVDVPMDGYLCAFGAALASFRMQYPEFKGQGPRTIDPFIAIADEDEIVNHRKEIDWLPEGTKIERSSCSNTGELRPLLEISYVRGIVAHALRNDRYAFVVYAADYYGTVWRTLPVR